MSKPSNYYAMSYEERKAYDQQQRAIEDAEYEAGEAKRKADRAARDARDAREHARIEIEEARRREQQAEDLWANENENFMAMVKLLGRTMDGLVPIRDSLDPTAHAQVRANLNAIIEEIDEEVGEFRGLLFPNPDTKGEPDDLDKRPTEA